MRKPINYDKVKKILASVLIVLLLVEGGYIASYFIQTKQYQAAVDAVKEEVQSEEDNSIDWDKLKNKNSDTVGWLKIDGTKIDTPVVQSKDNSFYLNHDFNKKYRWTGCTFMDYNCKKGEYSDNTIIYGHNMRDGTGFGELVKQYSTRNGAEKHRYISYTTPYNQDSKWLVVGAYYTNTRLRDDNGYAFPVALCNLTKGVFEMYIKQISERFVYAADIDINKNDKLLTLYTCTYGYEGERFIVVAKLIEEEDEPEKVDYYDRGNARQTQRWYDKRHLNNPFGESDHWLPYIAGKEK